MAGLESMVVEEVRPAEKPVDREKVNKCYLYYYYKSALCIFTENFK